MRRRDDAVAPAILRGIKRVINALQQGFEGIFGLAGNRETNADRDRQLVAGPDEEGLVGDRQAEPVGDDRRAAEICLGHHDDKFLATQAADQIDAAHIVQRALGELAQYIVAREMPIAVVDLLEMVDVEHHDSGRGAAFGKPRHQLGHMREDIAPVVKAGQLVGERQGQAAAVVLVQPVLQALAADLGAHPRQQFVAVDRSDEIVVGAEIEPLGQARQLAGIGDQQDRQLPRRLGGAPLRDEPQRVAVRHRQAGDHELDGRIEQRLRLGAAFRTPH